MSSASSFEPELLARLSALADGELDPASAGTCCDAWRARPGVGASWHAYQLIGDVLRSDDLAADPAHDAAFLRQVRERLSQEPVVIAPHLAPLSRRGREATAPHPLGSGRDRWKWPSAVAAGFVIVSGVFMLARPPASVAPLATLAQGNAGAGLPMAARPEVGPAVGSEAPGAAATPEIEVVTVARQGVLRDPRLDSYLAAHKQFSGSSALGVPSTFLRAATVETPRE